MDFTGTGCEIRGNLNAPESVVHSAIIYCMRSMLDTDIPLNAGCLVPLQSAPLHKLGGYMSNSSFSQYPDRVTTLTIKDSRGLWRERVDISENRRRGTQGIPRLCRQPRLHKVRFRSDADGGLHPQ